ncbi:hypothetical protein [Shewanella mangrovisoli]|uniref:hypothetical protein n=1 Tax=Shewanella mangrovisoli TaxID=2864211 RepID=UPI0035B9C742
MTKSAIVSILLCAAVLLGAMYFGGWTKHPYVQELTTEIRKASAVIEPKKPSAEAMQDADNQTDVSLQPKGVWDQMRDDATPQKRLESQLFKQSLPNQEATAKPVDSGAGATSAEAAKHNSV